MKILMIAPEPFFEPRGTPFSEYYRIKALSALGHTIDLVTYPIGEDKKIEGLTIHRCIKPPFIKRVKTGPSLVKLILDFFLFFSALTRMIRNRKKYDLIHTHEEASVMGAFFSKLFRVPHLYDMHSSLVQQMDNFQFTKSKVITGFFKWMEKISLKNARSIIVICKSLYEYAATITDEEKLTTIENFIDDTPETLDTVKEEALRLEFNPMKKPLVVYTGTLEKYQGIPLLLDSLRELDKSIHLLLVGGKPDQIAKIKASIKDGEFKDRIIFTGRRPFDDIPYFLKIADVLVSPRILGTNIPLKIYQYLKSGRPVVATNLYTHTQTLTDDIAILRHPDPKDFAQGIMMGLSDRGKNIAENAVNYCRKNYSPQKYFDLVATAMNKALQ